MSTKTFNPAIFNGVTKYVYDPDTGNTTQPPANGNWAITSRWQGATPNTITQINTDLFVSTLDTGNIPFRTVTGGGPHNVLSFTNLSTTKQRPFGDYVTLSWNQQISQFYTSDTGLGVAQLSAYMYFKDPAGTFFAILFCSFDNRFTNYTPAIGSDGTTFFASTPVGNTKYCMSSNSMDTYGSPLTNYGLIFTRAHMQQAISDLIASGVSVAYPTPQDWVLHEAGILHEIFTSNDNTVGVTSGVSFSSLNVSSDSLFYSSSYSFNVGFPTTTTLISGVHNIPDAYQIQETTANGYNVGVGKQTVRFTWRSHRYFELNPVGHFAFILRHNIDAFTEATRRNEGNGLLFGNLTGYTNPNTGHTGNPVTPSTIVETWYNGLAPYGNDLIPGTSWSGQLQDDVTYDVEINSIVNSAGQTLVSYSISSGGILLVSIPPTLDGNTYIDHIHTGFAMGQVFQGADGNTPTPGWNIQITNFSITWSGADSTYSITPNVTNINEGGTVTWTITTTNVPDGTILYWTNSGTTDGADFSDFVVGPSDGLSGGVIIVGNTATFTRTLANDLKTEGPETIIMNLRTGSIASPIVATAGTVIVNDTSLTQVGATYIISPNITTVNEGGSVTWTVNTTNVPDNTTLYWTNSGTTDGADFSDFVVGPSDGLSGPFVITSGVGTFSRTLANDLKTEGTETIIMSVRTGGILGAIVTTAATVLVNDTSVDPGGSTPAYSVSPDKTSVNEGGTVTWNVTTRNVSSGTVLYYVNNGTTNDSDFNDSATGYFTIDGVGNGSFSRTLRVDTLTEGTETIIMSIKNSPSGSALATAATVTVNDTSISITPGAETYYITPNTAFVNEGDIVFWYISTTNIPDGTVLYWTNSGTTNPADFTDVVLPGTDGRSGSVVINNNIAQFSRTVKNDTLTEGLETIIIQLRTTSIAGPIVATAPAVTVNDTSLGSPIYTITPDIRSVKEGGVVNYIVDTDNVAVGTTLYWTTDALGSTAIAADFVDQTTSGVFTVSTARPLPGKAYGRFSRRITKDHLSEGSESMIVRVRTGSRNGPIVATSVPVSIVDTSRTPIIKWENTGTLGTLVPGQISDLYVKASITTSTIYPKYQLLSGELPNGLSLNRDGTISGAVSVNTFTTASTSTSVFSVAVNDSNNNNLLNGEFSIIVKQSSNIEYTEMYCKPFLNQTKRSEFINFISDNAIFPSSLLYRPIDNNYGRQDSLKVVIDFGVKKLSLTEYANIMSVNFYKRQLSLGEIKTAISKNTDGSTKYELIYLDVIDKHVNAEKISIPTSFTFNGVTYYPPSIPNMRGRIANQTSITTVRNPSFMNYVQTSDSIKLGYISFVPLCFALPGKSATIIRKIKESNFKFNTFNFEIDRIIVQDSQGQTGAKYLLLSRNSKLA